MQFKEEPQYVLARLQHTERFSELFMQFSVLLRDIVRNRLRFILILDSFFLI